MKYTSMVPETEILEQESIVKVIIENECGTCDDPNCTASHSGNEPLPSFLKMNRKERRRAKAVERITRKKMTGK